MRSKELSAAWKSYLCVAILALVTACANFPAVHPAQKDADASGERSSGSEILGDQFSVLSSPVSQDLLEIHGLVVSGGSLVALASTAESRARTVLRSDDGGVNWTQAESIPDIADLTSSSYVTVSLMAAGNWLVAVRSGERTDSVLSPEQSVAISSDAGSTWRLVDLPVPDGALPVVSSATEVDGRLVLGGTTQTVRDGDDPGRAQAYDAALWVNADTATQFERLATATFDGIAFNQQILQLVLFDGQLIAIGTDSTSDPNYPPPPVVAWASTDGGQSWAQMAGLLGPGGFHEDLRPALVIGDSLVLRFAESQMALASGSNTWLDRPHDGYSSHADELALPDGGTAVTWTDREACEQGCSIGYAGRIQDETVQPTRLDSIADCAHPALEEDPEDPQVEPHAPGLIGDQVTALVACGWGAGLAFSGDGGESWTTAQLYESGADGEMLSVIRCYDPQDFYGAAYVYLPDQDALVALMMVSSTFTTSQDGGISGRIVALRISSP